MSEHFVPPSADALRRMRALAERELSREELAAAISACVTDVERESTVELITWFRRRYPTPRERLNYARLAYARWARSFPHDT